MFSIKKSLWFSVWLVIFSFQSSNAQIENKLVSHKIFDTDHGLSSSNVRKIISDEYGFVWIATRDGLNRYDGRTFLKFNENETDLRKRTVGNDFLDVIYDSTEKIIWAITSNGGLNKISTGLCKVIGRITDNQLFDDSSGKDWCKKFFLRNNLLYIISHNNTICAFDIKQNKVADIFRPIDGPINEDTTSDNIFVTSDSQILMFINNGSIWHYALGTKKIQKIYSSNMPRDASKSAFFPSYVLVNNDLIISSKIGLLNLNLQSLKVERPKNLLSVPKQIVERPGKAIFYQNSQLFFSNDLGIYKVDMVSGKSIQIVPLSSGNSNKEITNVFSIYNIDRTCWIGSQGGVLMIQDILSPFIGFTESQDGDPAKISYSFHLLPLNDSILATCAFDGFFAINFQNGLIKQIDNRQAYYQVFPINKKEIGLSALGYFRLLDEKSPHSRIARMIADSIKNDFIIASIIYQDSLLFLASGTRKGIYEVNLKQNTIKIINKTSSPVTLEDLGINNFFIDRLGRLFVVSEQKIARYNIQLQTIDHFVLSDLVTKTPLEIVMDGCETDSNFYFAVYGKGIIETDKNLNVTKIISAEGGLANQGVYKIFFINDSLIITGSNRGLYSYNVKTGKTKAYYKEQGIHSNNFDETSATKFGNLLFFGGSNGVTMIRTDNIRNNPNPPSVFFSEISTRTSSKVTDTFDLNVKAISLPNNYSEVLINFTGIEYINPDQVNYQYRIKEIQTEWINLGTQNFIRLIGISPGTYHLQLQAFNEDGVPSEIKELTLIFLPKWYQTWWFRALVVLAIAAIIYGLYRMRINQLKRVNKIRNQLASDLHDDLGSTLNSIKVYSNLAMMEKNNDHHLVKIKESTQGAINGVRDLIWVLDDKKDSPADLLARIRQFAEPICAANQIAFNVRFDDSLSNYKFGKEEKRYLYMILKESINNCIKYADGSSISLEINANNGKPAIVVADNGRGFDIATVQYGNGLNNIRNRAKEIHYTATIDSAIGKGTRISLQKV